MSGEARRWQELQDRWAAGERLSPDEEQARLEFAATDDRARRELDFFRALSEWPARDRREGDLDAEAALVARVLERVGVKPVARLRAVPLTRHGVDGQETSGTATSGSRGKRSRVVAVIGVVAASAAMVVGVLVLRGRVGAPGSSTASVAGAGVGLAVVDPPGLARSELMLASGEVTSDGVAVEVGHGPLTQGQRLTTARGRACIDVDPTIDVCLGERAEVLLESLSASDIRIRVVRGTVVAALTPRPIGRTFSLIAGDVAATARGTIFAVEQPADGEPTSVVVVEGKVEVTAPAHAARLVSSHTRLDLGTPSRQDAVTQVGRGDESRFLTLLAPRTLWQDPKLGVLAVAPGEEGAWAKVGEDGPFALPLCAYLPAGAHHLVMGDRWGVEVGVEVDVTAGATRRVDPLVAKQVDVAESSSAPSRTGVRGRTARALLDDARREIGNGRPKVALLLYEQVRAAYPASPEAVTVLVTMGKIELDLGMAAKALAHFDAYLQRGGSLAPEALGGKIRALRALGRTAEERAAIRQYLSENPDGFESPVLKKRLDGL